MINGECEIIEASEKSYRPYGTPDEAVYRGTTYIGGGKDLHSQGVEVLIYETPPSDNPLSNGSAILIV